jgi:zinc transporter 1/2/3
MAHSDSVSTLIKAYMMELSVALHSVIIGMSMGVLSQPSEMETLHSLIVAISFHQFMEGLGLGTVLQSPSLNLSPIKRYLFITMFGISVPVGIIIGILITRNGTPGHDRTLALITGSLNSLAAGILIYVALVEMVAEDFQASAIATRGGLKACMIAALLAGSCIMALLAAFE